MGCYAPRAMQREMSRERFRRLAESANVVPVWREVVADDLTPVAAFAAVAAAPDAGGFLLESVVGGEKQARYSFVGCEPLLVVRGGGDWIERRVGGVTTREEGVDPFAALASLLWVELQTPPAEALPELPRFWGGAVGAIPYDAVKRFEPKIAGYDPTTAPEEMAFGVGHLVLVFDNLRQTLQVVVPALVGTTPAGLVGSPPDEAYDAAQARIDDALARLAVPRRLPPLTLPSRDLVEALPASSFSRADFEQAVRDSQEHIRAGDIFQVVLSQRFEVPQGDVSPFDVYRAMRVVNPSPYMYFLRLPNMDVAGASPETLVRVEDGVATLRPIAGTRPRGATEDEDAALAEELLADRKEIAEHVMLVDLGRNDLGRIAAPGSVRIADRMVIERYSHVMHIVSSVEATLAPGMTALDVVRATFPAGTLSGAPKVRAMQIIDAAEPVPRGLYGGAVGYLGFDGNADLAIAIRTCVAQDGKLTLQAGAGIVEASEPAKEYEETVNKARAGLVAIEAARRSPG